MTQRKPPSPASGTGNPAALTVQAMGPSSDPMIRSDKDIGAPSGGLLAPAPAIPLRSVMLTSAYVTACDLPVPAFPPPQLPPILTAVQPGAIPPSVAGKGAGAGQVAPPRPLRQAPVVPPPLPVPPPLAITASHDAEPSALPLPRKDEPLTRSAVPRPASPLPSASGAPLARDRSLTKPGSGLLGALNNWLRSTGQLLMSGFMVKKKKRRPVTPPVSLRERVELTQLRAENRRLRTQLDGITHDGMRSRAKRESVED